MTYCICWRFFRFRFCICRCRRRRRQCRLLFLFFSNLRFMANGTSLEKHQKVQTLKTPIVKWQNFWREKLFLDIKIILNQASAFCKYFYPIAYTCFVKKCNFTYLLIYSFTLNIYFQFSLTKGWSFLSPIGESLILFERNFSPFGDRAGTSSPTRKAFQMSKRPIFWQKYFPLSMYFNFL